MDDKQKHFWPEKALVLGTGISLAKRGGVVRTLSEWVGRGSQRAFVVTANAEILMWAKKHKSYREILNRAQLVITDGFGLMPAYWWQVYWRRGGSLRERLNILDWWRGFGELERYPGRLLVGDLCSASAKRKWRIFLLGGQPGVAEKAAQVLKSKFGGSRGDLRVVGFSGPENVVGETVEEWKEIKEKVNSFRPHFLFVAFGHPRQEEWIAKHLSDLDVGVAMGVGGTLDYIVGSQKKPATVFQRLGIEAFWRLLTQPRRWRRVWTALVEFPLSVVFGS